MMKIDIMTLFPDMCESVLCESIIGRARKNNIVEINCTDIRDYAGNKHNRVDDAPFGGGMGMVMQAGPIYECFMSIVEKSGSRPHLIYLTPKGKTLTQKRVKELAEYEHIAMLCGHYEGVDERVIEEIVDEEISIGDYVLTGGELPALVLADSICRMVEGVLPDESCYTEESHYNGLLEYPQYTRPQVWHDRAVPEILLSGDHAKIRKWREEQAIITTKKKRPDMLKHET